MAETFENVLISVWRQVLIDDAPMIKLGTEIYAVRRTPSSKLREVDFVFDGQRYRGLEQNPKTTSRWAALAREGKPVMQFLQNGKYIANVFDGKAQLYGSKHGDRK